MTAPRTAIEDTSADTAVTEDPFAAYSDNDQLHLRYVAVLIQHIRNVGTVSTIARIRFETSRSRNIFRRRYDQMSYDQIQTDTLRLVSALVVGFDSSKPNPEVLIENYPILAQLAEAARLSPGAPLSKYADHQHKRAMRTLKRLYRDWLNKSVVSN
jgi:hypothetical protein